MPAVSGASASRSTRRLTPWWASRWWRRWPTASPNSGWHLQLHWTADQIVKKKKKKKKKKRPWRPAGAAAHAAGVRPSGPPAAARWHGAPGVHAGVRATGGRQSVAEAVRRLSGFDGRRRRHVCRYRPGGSGVGAHGAGTAGLGQRLAHSTEPHAKPDDALLFDLLADWIDGAGTESTPPHSGGQRHPVRIRGAINARTELRTETTMSKTCNASARPWRAWLRPWLRPCRCRFRLPGQAHPHGGAVLGRRRADNTARVAAQKVGELLRPDRGDRQQAGRRRRDRRGCGGQGPGG